MGAQNSVGNLSGGGCAALEQRGDLSGTSVVNSPELRGSDRRRNWQWFKESKIYAIVTGDANPNT